MFNENYILELKNVTITYNPDIKAVKDLSINILANQITSIIGLDGSGKTTLLRAINRLHELYPYIKTSGQILLEGQNIMDMDVTDVRRNIGMVFSKPNPFPHCSIFDNVISGYKMNNIPLNKKEKVQMVEECLENVGLWDEVKDKLKEKPDILTIGQQQRLCIARTVALNPKIILMDDPTNDMESPCITKIENLMYQLKSKCTVIFVSNDLAQVARMSDYTIFMEDGELVEYGNTAKLFWNPTEKRTEEYITNHA